MDAGTRRAAYFPYLPPGSYRFRVIAANSDGVWNNEGASLGIVVAAPFYRTWWFVMLIGLGVAGVALLGYQRRFASLRARHAAQEAFSRQLIESQENERQRIAAELHDSLGQHLLVIKNWATLGLMLAPEDAPNREQLNEISATASQAIGEARQIVYDLRPYQLDKIGLTNTLKFMVEQVAASSGIHFTSKIAELDGLFAPDEEITFYRVVQGCLNNIVKHSAATKARVLIEHDGRALALRVEDNGRGFVVGSLNAKHHSFGLTGMTERVRILGVEQTISSTPGQGTVVTVRMGLNLWRVSSSR